QRRAVGRFLLARRQVGARPHAGDPGRGGLRDRGAPDVLHPVQQIPGDEHDVRAEGGGGLQHLALAARGGREVHVGEEKDLDRMLQSWKGKGEAAHLEALGLDEEGPAGEQRQASAGEDEPKAPAGADHPWGSGSARAGLPKTVLPAGTSRTTTLPAPTTAPSPTVSEGRMTALAWI